MFGCIRASVRGLTSPSSKMRGFLGEGRYVSLEMIRSKNGFMIVGADVSDSQFSINLYPRRLFIRLLSHIEYFCGMQRDESVFTTLNELYDLLSSKKNEVVYREISIIGLTRLLVYLGYWRDHSITDGDILSQIKTQDIAKIEREIKEVLSKVM